ncbi:MAG: ribosome biogenesis GTPase Der [Phycisphaerales bacterium]
MSLFRVAIVGRPNVGKSSLLNMLARQRVSIVDDMPGVTRDRVTTVVELTGPLKTEQTKLVEITDTGGFGVYTAQDGRYDDAGQDLHDLTGDIEKQIAHAVERADLILFVIDAQDGVTAVDEMVAKLLRERGLRPSASGEGRGSAVPVQVVANKVDNEAMESLALEASALGFGEPWVVSALHNFRRRDFSERLYETLPETALEDRAGFEPELRIALVGKRNAGKSTFVNALAGEDRVIVSEIAGTTRDAIDVRFEMDGRSLVAIDTAGVRKRAKMEQRVEHFADMRARASIERADVVLLCIDATQDISGVDKRLGRYVAESCKPCLIVVTKWDLAEGRKNVKGQPVSTMDYLKYVQDAMPGLSFAPIVFSASPDGRGLKEVVQVAFELFEQARTRVKTSELNDVMRSILEERGPTSKLGTKVKVLYTAQVAVQPPTIVLVVNRPDLFTDDYERYMLNRIRERTPFAEVPVRLLIRERKRAELGDLLSGEHRAQQEAKREAAAKREGFSVEGVDERIVREELRSRDDD